MSNLKDLFDMPDSLKDMTTEPPKRKTDDNLYTVNPKDGKDNVYKAKIRFLMNINNKNESIIATHYHWLTDANGENPVYVVDPSSVGESSPINDLFWKFKKSTNPAEQRMADMLSRKTKYFSLVQIIEDEQHPELVGKIKVFSYGTKIKTKLDEEDSDEDGGNPFNILSARTFKLEVKIVAGFANYDSCRFVGSKTALVIDGKSISEDKDATRVLEYFKNAPSLDDYKFKPWSAELTEKVNKNLATYTKGFVPTAIENAMKQENDDEDVRTPVQTTSYNTEEEDDDFLEGINI